MRNLFFGSFYNFTWSTFLFLVTIWLENSTAGIKECLFLGLLADCAKFWVGPDDPQISSGALQPEPLLASSFLVHTIEKILSIEVFTLWSIHRPTDKSCWKIGKTFLSSNKFISLD